MSRRITVLGVILALCFTMILAQLTSVQVIHAGTYTKNPHNPVVIDQELDNQRGEIRLSDGTVLAQSIPNPDITKSSPFHYERVYNTTDNDAEIYADIVGVDSEIYTNYGVESYYNSQLEAHNAPVKTLGDLLSTHVVTDSITLTIDPTLQAAAVSALGGVNGKVGAIVAIDPKTGAILAMYGNPTFDPNPLASPDVPTEKQAFKVDTTRDPHEDNFEPLTPTPTQESFAPGSTMKVVTAASAYDHAANLVKKQFPVESCYSLPDSNKPLCNFHHGTCGGDIATMLPPSCDTGFANLGVDLGAANLTTEAESFGFDQIPPIDLPTSPLQASVFGGPTADDSSYLTNNIPYQAYSAIGQGNDKATPLQMALVASAFADNGVMMTPHVMQNVYDSDGHEVAVYQPKPWKTSTTPQTAKTIVSLMEKVASVGTASGIFNPADQVAAKTGTAQENNNTTTTAWMIALAPASNPTIAIAVVLPDLAGGFSDVTGATSAGPIMKQMIQTWLAR